MAGDPNDDKDHPLRNPYPPGGILSEEAWSQASTAYRNRSQAPYGPTQCIGVLIDNAIVCHLSPSFPACFFWLHVDLVRQARRLQKEQKPVHLLLYRP